MFYSTGMKALLFCIRLHVLKHRDTCPLWCDKTLGRAGVLESNHFCGSWSHQKYHDNILQLLWIIYSVCSRYNSTAILNKAGVALRDSSFTGKQRCFVGLALPGVWQFTLQHFGESINNFHIFSPPKKKFNTINYWKEEVCDEHLQGSTNGTQACQKPEN